MTKRRPVMIGQLLGVGLACALIVSGCAHAVQRTPVRAPNGHDNHRVGDLAIDWRLTRQEGWVTAGGSVQHIGGWNIRLESVRLILVGYDDQGREVVRSHAVSSNPSTLRAGNRGIFEISATVQNHPALRFALETSYLWDQFPDE